MSRTVLFAAPGSRRPYVPAAALKDARAERDHYKAAVEEAQRILTVEDAMYEDVDSPGNMAWAVLTHALEAGA